MTLLGREDKTWRSSHMGMCNCIAFQATTWAIRSQHACNITQAALLRSADLGREMVHLM